MEGIFLSKLKGLGEPSEFWEYFEQLTKIPRCSEHEEKVRAFIKEEAERLSFETKVDTAGNLVIRIPAKQNQLEEVILQCHMDMVCEKNEGISHDFSKDPLEIKIIEIDNDYNPVFRATVYAKFAGYYYVIKHAPHDNPEYRLGYGYDFSWDAGKPALEKGRIKKIDDTKKITNYAKN